MKKNTKCYCLYINITDNYTSFKIERGKYLGKLKSKTVCDGYHIVEHEDDEVNYLLMDDISKTEKEAYKKLVKILNDKIYG